jgi:hypothetical protein
VAVSYEQAIQNDIRLELGHGSARLFRNNTGCLRNDRGRVVCFGLAKGSSDLIGWKTVEITPDMVGMTVAVFTAIEVKDQGRATPEQRRFISCVQQAGGFAGVARSVDEAKEIMGLRTEQSPAKGKGGIQCHQVKRNHPTRSST